MATYDLSNNPFPHPSSLHRSISDSPRSKSTWMPLSPSTQAMWLSRRTSGGSNSIRLSSRHWSLLCWMLQVRMNTDMSTGCRWDGKRSRNSQQNRTFRHHHDYVPFPLDLVGSGWGGSQLGDVRPVLHSRMMITHQAAMENVDLNKSTL